MRFNPTTDTTISTIEYDNTIAINGVTLSTLLSFDEVKQIMAVYNGIISSRSASVSSSNSTVFSGTNTTPVVRDFKAKYKVVELVKPGTKTSKIFSVQRDNGWTKNEKNALNKAIKALEGYTEYDIPFTKTLKDGRKVQATYTARCFKTRSEAEAAMAKLPQTVKVEYDK